MRRNVIAACLAVAVGLGVAAWLRRATTARAVLRLRDGTTLQVQDTTYAVSHTPTRGRPVPAWFRDKAPDWLLRFVGASRPGCTLSFAQRTNLVVWLEATTPGGGRSTAALPTLGFELVGPGGESSPGRFSGSCGLSDPRTGLPVTLYAIPFDVFPRRAASLRLRVRDAAGVVGEVPVANPAKGPFPAWTAGPVPQSATNDGVVFRLDSVRRARFTNNHVGTDQYVAMHTVWTDGAPATDWEVGRTMFEDPTGNLDWKGAGPGEPVWRAETLFFRRPSSVGPEGRVRLGTLPVPAPGQRVPADIQATVGAFKVKIAGFVGVGTYTWSNGVPFGVNTNVPAGSGTSMSDNGTVRMETQDVSGPRLLYRVTGLPDGGRVRIEGHDDRGRPVTGDMAAGYRDSEAFELRYAPDARTLELDFIPQAPRRMEFHFDPRGAGPLK